MQRRGAAVKAPPPLPDGYTPVESSYRIREVTVTVARRGDEKGWSKKGLCGK